MSWPKAMVEYVYFTNKVDGLEQKMDLNISSEPIQSDSQHSNETDVLKKNTSLSRRLNQIEKKELQRHRKFGIISDRDGKETQANRIWTAKRLIPPRTLRYDDVHNQLSEVKDTDRSLQTPAGKTQNKIGRQIVAMKGPQEANRGQIQWLEIAEKPNSTEFQKFDSPIPLKNTYSQIIYRLANFFVDGYGTDSNFTQASSLCQSAVKVYTREVFKSRWALNMLDASGKLPEGILQGNINAWGNWDQCLGIRVETSGIGEFQNLTFTGQYCLVKFSLVNDTKSINPNDMMSALGAIATVSFALCIPSVCSSEDLSLALESTLLQQTRTPQIECHVENETAVDFTAADIVVISIFSIFGMLMVLGSLMCALRTKISSPSDGKSSYIKTINSLIINFLECFAVQANMKKLFDTSSDSNSIQCLNGLRFISMSWVILGHAYAFLMVGKHKNIVHIISYLNDVEFSTIANSTVSVDSFFFLSGLLVAYISMKKLSVNRGRFNFIYFYVHRYIRLTPVLMMVIAFDATLYARLGRGPNWSEVYNSPLSNYNNCQRDWWKNLLYINNLMENATCLGQTWYLANDMQMYLFSPLVLLPLYHRPALGQLWTVLLITLFISVNGIITYNENLGPFNIPASNGEAGNAFSARYIKPWTRASPYLVGIYTGWFLYRIRRRNLRLPAVAVVTGWLLAFLTACLVIYGPHDYLRIDNLSKEPSRAVSVIYAMLHRTAWSLCLTWLVVACVSGYAGPINSILSWPAFIPLSRLTYASYLVSVDIQTYFWFSSKSPGYLDHTTVVMYFFGQLVVISAVAMLFALAFELPVLALERQILRARVRTIAASADSGAVDEKREPAESTVARSSTGVIAGRFELHSACSASAHSDTVDVTRAPRDNQ